MTQAGWLCNHGQGEDAQADASAGQASSRTGGAQEGLDGKPNRRGQELRGDIDLVGVEACRGALVRPGKRNRRFHNGVRFPMDRLPVP